MKLYLILALIVAVLGTSAYLIHLGRKLERSRISEGVRNEVDRAVSHRDAYASCDGLFDFLSGKCETNSPDRRFNSSGREGVD